MRVLIVEDSQLQAVTIARVLARAGFDAVIASTMAEALNHLDQSSFDAAVCDYHIPDVTGRELAQICVSRGIEYVYYTIDEMVTPPVILKKHPGELVAWLNSVAEQRGQLRGSR